MKYQKLENSEINTLKNQGCIADNWDTVFVIDGFNPDRVQNVHFSGEVKLGLFNQNVEIHKGIFKPSGIYNSYIKNCLIGPNVYINKVNNLVNYNIEENVIIDNVADLIVSGETTFGNGTKIRILNEKGGRELLIYDQLTSQIAYLMVTRRDDKQLINNLEEMIKIYVEDSKSDTGCIGHNSRIVNCLNIHNVNIGSYANINGVTSLTEGTIKSEEYAPAIVGEGVIAKSFIILTDSTVDCSAMLDGTFVGQGVKIGKQFSAENSAFFANSEGFHGEACSIFAGPYTVTHHKSTLLIAGMFSFYNAGSGSNQSNHSYKLGSVHQGILERGAKTGSFSYLMLPVRIGAFSAIIGKHYTNFDATNFPFSYILESEGKSLLMPAMNLCTVGTRRDSAKWKKRDRRHPNYKIDHINFELFNPYTIGRALNGIKILKKLEIGKKEEYVNYFGLQIKRSKISSAIKKYEMAINIFIGDSIINKIDTSASMPNFKELTKILATDMENESQRKEIENWIDLSGMLTSYAKCENFIGQVWDKNISTVSKLREAFNNLNGEYQELSWSWCRKLINNIYGNYPANLSAKSLLKIIRNWAESKTKMNELVLLDAKKEFNEKSQIGFGIDNSELKQKDFDSIRGTYDSNSFVMELRKEIIQIEKRAKQLALLIEQSI